MTAIESLAKILKNSKNAVFFGGAGMSTESGIPDFRSANGIYNQELNHNFSPEEMVSYSFFVEHTEEFFKFYREHLIFKDAQPNKGHIALAKLEEKGILRAIVTQNVDGLHQIAGSKTVYELHGSGLKWYCTECKKESSLEEVLSFKEDGVVPHCKECNGIVRPNVVLYEESLDDEVIENAIAVIKKADTLIVGGTSLAVWPAAGLINYFTGNHLVLINKTKTDADSSADLIIRKNIGETLHEAVNLIP